MFLTRSSCGLAYMIDPRKAVLQNPSSQVFEEFKIRENLTNSFDFVVEVFVRWED